MRTRNSNVRAIRSSSHIASSSSNSRSLECRAGTVATNEMDSNADTCCLGSNFLILEFTNRQADVYPYDKSYRPATNIPIVTGATAWTDPMSHDTFILVFHEALFYGSSLPHSLINPNQLRHNGLTVQDNPYSDDPMGINVMQEIDIPMKSSGTKILFDSRVQLLKNCPIALMYI